MPPQARQVLNSSDFVSIVLYLSSDVSGKGPPATRTLKFPDTGPRWGTTSSISGDASYWNETPDREKVDQAAALPPTAALLVTSTATAALIGWVGGVSLAGEMHSRAEVLRKVAGTVNRGSTPNEPNWHARRLEWRKFSPRTSTCQTKVGVNRLGGSAQH